MTDRARANNQEGEMKRRGSYSQVSCIAVSTFLIALAAPATARAGTGADFGCSTNTWLDSTKGHVKAHGETHCDAFFSGYSPRRHKLWLQRSRWYGWETLTTDYSGWRVPSFIDGAVHNYDCTGTGTHVFRARGVGEVLIPVLIHMPDFDVSPELRKSC